MAFSKQLQCFFLLTVLVVGFFGDSIHGMKDKPDNATEALTWITKLDKIKKTNAGLKWLAENVYFKKTISKAIDAINYLLQEK